MLLLYYVYTYNKRSFFNSHNYCLQAVYKGQMMSILLFENVPCAYECL